MIDFWAILVFAGIIVMFLLLFWWQKEKPTGGWSVGTEAINDFKAKDTNLILNSFLRAPTYFDNSKTSSEIISEDRLTGNYDRTRLLVEKYFYGLEYYNNGKITEITICIKDATKKLKEYSIRYDGNYRVDAMSDVGDCSASESFSYASTYIPSYDGQILNVKLGMKNAES